MALGLGTIGSLLAYIVVAEGGVAILDHLTGDPEGDVTRALQNLATTSQIEAQGVIAVGQQQQEQLQGRFAKFNRLPQQLLTTASLAEEQAAGLRGGRLVDTGVLDHVSSRLGLAPGELSARLSPARMGDFTGVLRSAGKPIPGT